MTQTLEQFGQTIKTKYPQYSNLSDTDVAQKVLDKYPQYQSQITVGQREVSQAEKPGFFSGPTFPAKEGGVKTIPGNIARTLGNIPSSVARLGRAVVAPINPFDTDSPLNIGGNIVKSAGALKEIFGLRGTAGVKDIGKGFIDTSKKISEAVGGFAKKAIEQPAQTVSNIAKVGIEDPLLLPSLLYAPGKFAGKGDIISKLGGRGAKPIERVGEKLEASGIKTAETQKRAFVEDLVSPYRTPTVKKEQVSRSIEKGFGPFLRTQIKPTASERAVATEVMKIPGIKKQSYQRNYNIVRDYNIQKAQQLEAEVAANDFIISRREVFAGLKRAQTTLSESPLIVGDAEKTAAKLLAGAENILLKHPGTGSGLLRARKEYDAWVLNQKPKAFDAKSENAFTTANRAIRDSMNEIFIKNAQKAGVKAEQSFKEQSALYRGMENLEIKAAKEADTFLGRVYQKIENVLGIRDKLTQTLGLLVGGGVFGAAILFAKPLSVIMGTGWVTYKAGKLIMKPKVREILGKILKQHGSKFPEEDRVLLEQLLIPNAPIEQILEQLE